MEESSYYRDPNVSLQHMATSSSTSSPFIMPPTMTYEQYQLQNELHQNMLQQHELQLQQLSMHQHQHHHHHQSQEHVIGINSNGLGSTGTFSQGIVSVGGTIPWSMASDGSPEQLMMHSSYPTSSSTFLSAPGQQQQQYQGSDLIASTTTSSYYKSRGGKNNISSAIRKTSRKKSKQKSKDVIMTNHGQGRGGGGGGEGESVLEEDVNNHSESDESIRRAKGLSKRSRTISDIGGDEGGGLDEDNITHSNYDPTASSSSSGMISNLNQSGSHLYHHHQQQQYIQKERGQIHFQQGGVIGGKSPLLQHHPFYSSQVSTTSPHLRVQGVMDSPTLLGQSGYTTLGSDQQQQPLQQMRVSLQSMTSIGEQQGARIINIDEMNRGRGGDRLHVVEAHHIQDPDEEPNAVRRAKGLSRRARATSDASGLNDDDEEEEGINTEDEDILPDSHLYEVDDRSAHISTMPNSGGLLNNRQRNPFSSQSIQNKHTSSEETSFGFSPVWRESNPGSALITVNGPNEAVPTQFQPQPTSGKGLFTTTNNVGRSIGGPSDFVLDGEKAIGIETTDFIESNTEQGQSLLTSVASAASTSSTLSTSLTNGGKRASPLPTQGKHNLPVYLSQDGIAANGSSNTDIVERQKPEGVHFEFETIGNSHTVTSTVLESGSSQSAQLSTLTEGMRPQVVGPRQSSLKGRGKSSLTLSGLPETDFERSLLSHLLNFEDLTEDALATPTSRSENSSLSGDIGSATKKAAAAVSSLSDDINIKNLIVVGSVGGVGVGGYGIGVEGGGKRGKGGKGYSGKGVTNTGGKGVLYSSTGSAVSQSSGVIDCGLMPLQESFMNTSMNPTVAALQAARYADREMITQLESKLSHLRGIAAHLAGEVINLTGKLVKAKWGKAQADRDLLIAATILHGQFIKSESGKGIDEKQVGVQPTDSTVLSSEEGIGEGVSFIAVPGPKIATSSIPRVLSDNHLSEASC
jgi:hypothetical protein